MKTSKSIIKFCLPTLINRTELAVSNHCAATRSQASAQKNYVSITEAVIGARICGSHTGTTSWDSAIYGIKKIQHIKDKPKAQIIKKVN